MGIYTVHLKEEEGGGGEEEEEEEEEEDKMLLGFRFLQFMVLVRLISRQVVSEVVLALRVCVWGGEGGGGGVGWSWRGAGWGGGLGRKETILDTTLSPPE